MPRLIRNRARCKQCRDIIESTATHQQRYCSCRAIFVDGGLEYTRRGGDVEQIDELSVYEVAGDALAAQAMGQASASSMRGTACSVCGQVSPEQHTWSGVRPITLCRKHIEEAAAALREAAGESPTCIGCGAMPCACWKGAA